MHAYKVSLLDSFIVPVRLPFRYLCFTIEVELFELQNQADDKLVQLLTFLFIIEAEVHILTNFLSLLLWHRFERAIDWLALLDLFLLLIDHPSELLRLSVADIFSNFFKDAFKIVEDGPVRYVARLDDLSSLLSCVIDR